jgi:sialate O-acetylesterase
MVPERDSMEMNVPEAKDYQLVYDLDLAKLSHQIIYSQDRSSQILQPFSRIAYFLELQPANGQPEYLYVSMKAFTSDLKKIGVPTSQSGACFQCNVEDMDVFSNAKGIVSGTHLSGGNIEFWPSNYGPENGAKVPGASSATFDFGDSPSGEADGYGSMQVHNHDERQTLFAVNHWSEGEGADIGIGNQPKDNPDWTFAHNAKSYVSKRLRVLVRCK